MKDIFMKLMFNIMKKIHELHNDLPLLPEKMKFEKAEKLVSVLLIYMIKLNMLFAEEI